MGWQLIFASMRRDWHNIPNLLGLARLIFAPVPVLLVALNPDSHPCWWWALGIFALLALTDKIDGYIAKHYHLETAWGKVLDPLADKVLVFPLFVALVILINTPVLWAALVIMAAREIHVTALLKRGDYASGVIVSARQSGRIKMVAQVALLAIMLVPIASVLVIDIAAGLTTLIAIYSWIDYIVAARSAKPRN